MANVDRPGRCAGSASFAAPAWLAPEPIPNFLLEIPVPDIPPEDLDEAFADLAAYSLVRRSLEKQEFAIHRLVKDVTRRSLPDEARRRSLVEALKWVNAAFTGSPQDVRTWSRLDPIAPHARAIVEHADAANIGVPTSRLMNELGLLLGAKARYSEAEPLHRRALAIDEKSLGADHPMVGIRLNNLAVLLQATNRLREAESLYRRALAIDEKSFDPEHPTVAIRSTIWPGCCALQTG